MIDLLNSFTPEPQAVSQQGLVMEIGATFGPYYINFYSTRSIKLGSYSADPATNFLTLTAHGLVNGDMAGVQPVTSATPLTDGLESGAVYFVVNKTTDTLQLSLTSGGPEVDFTSADSGFLYKLGTPYDLIGHQVWAWVKHDVEDADNALIMDLGPLFTGSAITGFDWQVQIAKTKAQTFSLDPGIHVWDLLVQFPDGSRRLLIEDTFTIRLPATHPYMT